MKKNHFSHPGEILWRVYMTELGISVSTAAAAMAISRQRLNEIVRGRRAITADTALRLGRYLGTGAELWLNLQTHFDLASASVAAGNSMRHIKPVIFGGENTSS